MIAGSLIATGMNWWQALISVAVGYSICAVVLVFNGMSGAQYHVGFPVVSRSSFGLVGSYIPVLNRYSIRKKVKLQYLYRYILIVILPYLPIVNSVIMACVWYGVQAWIGVSCDYRAFYGCACTCSNILVFL
jgi:NCS1 family nucleobase:cation symporter-1